MATMTQKPQAQLNPGGNLASAKRRLVSNVGSNFVVLGLNAFVNLGLAPFLISRLGVAAYGMVVLATTIASYLRVLPGMFDGALLRFLSVTSQSDLRDAQVYFYSAKRALIVLSIILLGPVFLFIIFAPNIFQIPEDSIQATQYLLGLTLLGGLISIALIPYRTALFFRHRFLTYNAAVITTRLTGLAFLITAFIVWTPSLEFVGLYLFIFMAGAATLAMFFCKLRSDDLYTRLPSYSWAHLKKLIYFARYLVLYEMSQVLLIGGTYLVINITLGAEATGYFGPLFLLAMFVNQCGFQVAGVLRPIVFEYIGSNQHDQLALRTRQATRIIAFIFGTAMVALIGIAQELLRLWLGPPFPSYAIVLAGLVVGIYIGSVLFVPYKQVFRGKDAQGVATILAMVTGIVHIVSLWLVLTYTDYGLIEVGFIFVLTAGVARALAQSLDNDRLLGQPYGSTLWSMRMCFFLPLICASGAAYLAWGTASPLVAVLWAVLGTLICFVLGWLMVLKPEDRLFVTKLIRRV